jgi:hypothetical protein
MLALPQRKQSWCGERETVERPEVLRREIKALVFDQYGTIVDMQGGLVAAVTPFLQDKGWDGKPNSFVTWWRPPGCQFRHGPQRHRIHDGRRPLAGQRDRAA